MILYHERDNKVPIDVFILFDVLQINKKDEIPFFIVYSCTVIPTEINRMQEKKLRLCTKYVTSHRNEI